MKKYFEKITNSKLYAIIIAVIIFFVLNINIMLLILRDNGEIGKTLSASELTVVLLKDGKYVCALESGVVLNTDTEYNIEVITDSVNRHINVFNGEGRDLEYVYDEDNSTLFFIQKTEYLLVIKIETNYKITEYSYQIIAE